MVAPQPGAQFSTTFVGWRYEVVVGDPGPPPRRPTPTDQERISEDWIAGQKRTEAHTNRPLKYALYALAGFAALCLLLWPIRILPGILVLGAFLVCLAVTLPILIALLQSRQVMRERVATEQRRIERIRASQEQELREKQEEHARRYTEWQGRKRAYEAQPHWYGVSVPAGVGTVLVSGGTEVGWSAVLTTIGASRLRGGGDLTVVDLSGRAVTADLTSLAEQCGVASKVWVLPADLTTMHLGTNLAARQRARVLAAVVRASEAKSDPDADQRLLLRLLEVVGAQASVATLTSGLRALAEPTSTRDDDPTLRLLSAEQLAEVRQRCGSDQATTERAWELERHLAPFEGLGTRTVEQPYAQVKVIATDRVSGDVAARAFGTYTLASLSELLDLRSGSAPNGTVPWSQTVAVCGADVLPAAEVDRAIRAARGAGVGLVLMFRENDEDESAVPRLADDHCLTVVMRQPGTRPAARMASRLLEGGTGPDDQPASAATAPDGESGAAGESGRAGHDLRVHRLTEVIGEALRDTAADGHHKSGSSNPAEADTTPVTVRPKAKAVAPLDLVKHVRSATGWGRATTQASDIDTPGDTGRVRPLRLDSLGLRNLPPTAMIVPGDGGLVLADANPGILTLPTATLGTVEDARAGLASFDVPQEPVPDDDPPPNLGPPPERLDWRTT
ncbi:heme exporter protein D [Lipingzhangella halophila]|uniref:Heme exporter protein D n=1 Tax=Lipingzhangella halophila TaxID=1783352 RepID=A0A7W7W5T8_9ACTN|nr:hypothetical protein [Lipingzhangella halophila]MBB4934155.1 heme exporter protein D [Lipingzhangella halophila]